MQNTRSKKLLACFLAALGLSMNSLNVSAKHGQIRENIKSVFGCGKKSMEKTKLDELAEGINSKTNDLNEYDNMYPLIAKDLYKNLQSIVARRRKKNYSSKLLNNETNNLLSSYPGNICGTKTKQWIKKVADAIGNARIKGGNFTVLSEKIQNSMKALNDKLEGSVKASDNELVIDSSNDKNDKNNELIKAWSVNCDDSSVNSIECYLYENGNLEIKTHNSSGIELKNILDFSVISEGTKELVKEVSIEDGITSTGNGTFASCSNLKKVTIPDSVQSIGTGAFNGCKNLKEITIPNSVKWIGTCAFYDCKNLKEITIPNSVEEIGKCPFKGCENLTVKIAKSNEYVIEAISSSGVKYEVI